MKKDLVSIMIPCYNAERYVSDCLNALLNQTYNNIEIIIVNDGSTDKSKDIIKEYSNKFKEKNIKFISLYQKNAGQASAINKALKEVSGEFLMWQDADDWYQEDAIENMINYIKKENLNVVRGEAVYRDENDLSKIIYHAKSDSPKDNNLFNKYLYERDSYCYPGIFIVRTSHFDKCVKERKIYESRAGQNWQLILPITYKEKAGYLNKVVYNYRVVSNSHYHSVKTKKNLIKRCDEHIDILFNVINSIEMSEREEKEIKKKLKIKYLKKKIKILCSNKLTRKIKTILKRMF